MDWVSEGFELLNILHLGYRETNASMRCTGQVVLRLPSIRSYVEC